MKSFAPTIQLVAFSALLIVGISGRAQGTFQNLTFEEANVSLPPGQTWSGQVSMSSALPGWNATIGGVQVQSAVFNTIALDSSEVGVIGTNNPLGIPPILGNYMGFIQAGFGGNTTLSQTGFIPMTDRSLFFFTGTEFGSGSIAPGDGRFSVNLNGIPLAFSEVDSAPDFNVWGADISTFAGTTSELQFELTSVYPNPIGAPVVFLDDVIFSASPVPEPGTLALFGTGAALLALCHRRKFRS